MIGDIICTRKKAREFPGFNSISQHCPSFPGISCAFPRFPGIFHAFPGFPMLSWDFQLSRDFPCLPGIFHAFLGFPMLSWDFPCFSRISHAFPEYSKFLEEYTPLRYYKVCSRKVAGERKTWIALALDLNFLKSFGQPLNRKPLALELWSYPWGTLVNQK